MEEHRICSYFIDEVEGMGLEVTVREVSPGRNNIYALLPGEMPETAPSLMFNGHLDTIPIGQCALFERHGDVIKGRGASDMKGGLASMLGAVKAILDAGIRLKGNLWLTAVVGHEGTEAAKDGPKALIHDLNSGTVSCDGILIGEGENECWIMSMGSMVYTITLTSKVGGIHTTHVPFEKNPIRSVGDILCGITELQRRLNRGTYHPLAGFERIDVGTVHAGDYFNRTPVRSTCAGTRRWLPGRNAKEVLEELTSLVLPLAQATDSDCRITMEHQREPFELPPDHPLVQTVVKAHSTVFGKQTRIVGKPIVADASLYCNLAGVPSMYYGPGSNTAHSDEEWISLNDIIETAKVYAVTAIEYCGPASPDSVAAQER